MTIRLLQGDALTVLRTLPAESVHAIGIDLHHTYQEMAAGRFEADAPLFAEVER